MYDWKTCDEKLKKGLVRAGRTLIGATSRKAAASKVSWTHDTDGSEAKLVEE
jgi:hypothetical protein